MEYIHPKSYVVESLLETSTIRTSLVRSRRSTKLCKYWSSDILLINRQWKKDLTRQAIYLMLNTSKYPWGHFDAIFRPPSRVCIRVHQLQHVSQIWKKLKKWMFTCNRIRIVPSGWIYFYSEEMSVGCNINLICKGETSLYVVLVVLCVATYNNINNN